MGKPLTVPQFAALGGHARAKSLSAERRKEIARQAVSARWGLPVPSKTKTDGRRRPKSEPATSEPAAAFVRRLEPELKRRIKQAELKNPRGQCVPDNVAKADFIEILCWIQTELETFNRSYKQA
jgi:hypothetical protein